MAAGFDFDGTNDYVTLADAAGYDVSPDGDSFALAFWVNPDARTSPEVLFDRSGWFKIWLDADNMLIVEFADQTAKSVRPLVDGVKQHVIVALKHASAVASGTADADVAKLLVDVDADWYTNGVNYVNDKRGKYVVYNRTDRTYGYGTVIPDVTFTASSDTVDLTTETVTTGTHGLTTGCPVIVTGDDVPAGLTSGNLYYVEAASATTLKFYDSAANAIAGGNVATGGLTDLTDVGSGTVTLAAKNDAIQLATDLCPDGNEVVYVFTEPWAAQMRVWVDGVRQDISETLTNFNTPADSAEVINVAQLKGGSLFYNGKMGNVAYWTPGWPNDALAAAIYNQGTELNYTNTAAADGAMTAYGYWAFDDNAASTAVDNDETTAARDGTAGANTDTYDTTTLDPTAYLTDRVLKFDSASVANGTTVTGTYIIEQVIWEGAGVTAGDDVILKNGNGDEFLHLIAEGTNVNQSWNPDSGYGVIDLEVDTIDSGIVWIYLQ